MSLFEFFELIRKEWHEDFLETMFDPIKTQQFVIVFVNGDHLKPVSFSEKASQDCLPDLFGKYLFIQNSIPHSLLGWKST